MPTEQVNDAKSFQHYFNVSRETIEALLIYEEKLLKWNKRINLISKTTENAIWFRHFSDSAQLINFLPFNGKSLLDIGSGAGFPGMVLSIIAKEKVPNLKFNLLDESTKRCAFLGEVARATNSPARILNMKIENLGKDKYDVITARAFAPLEKLIELAFPYLNTNGTLLLLKGEEAEKELESIEKKWSFKLESFKSLTSPNSKILIISELERE